MYRYDGLLVAEYHDEHGTVEVVDKDGVRRLHFGTAALQSLMPLGVEPQLVAPYERLMSACLLLNPAPATALLIGLGGGSVAGFLLRHNPDMQVQVVELRQCVVDAAREHFALPQDPHLQISIGCGAAYVAQCCERQAGRYDLIMVDAYGGDGMAAAVGSEQFFVHCRQLLSPNGVLVINTWRSQSQLCSAVIRHIVKVFESRVHFVPVGSYSNFIGFAVAATFPRIELQEAEQRALQLRQRHWHDYPGLLQDLRLSDPLNTLFIDE